MSSTSTSTYCLTHQRVEDICSPLGRVCRECAGEVRRRKLRRPRYAYWESQPPAFSLSGTPQFVYTLLWDDFRIRSLHSAGRDVSESRSHMNAGTQRV